MFRWSIPCAAVLALAAASCKSTASTTPPRTTPGGPAPAGRAATASQRDAWLQAFARGYFPGRSGQVFVVSRQGEFVVDRNPLYAFMHGSPWPYDTHVPLIFFGPPFVKPLVSDAPVSQQEVVPTLAALLGTAPPATAVGRTLRDALGSTTERPRVLALFVLDGTRADYLDTYRDVLPTLTKLRAGGASYTNAHVS